MESAKYRSLLKMMVAVEKGKVSFFFLLTVASAGFLIWMWLEVFMKLEVLMKSVVPALLIDIKCLLLNFANVTCLNSTDVYDFEKNYAKNIIVSFYFGFCIARVIIIFLLSAKSMKSPSSLFS